MQNINGDSLVEPEGEAREKAHEICCREINIIKEYEGNTNRVVNSVGIV